METDREVLLWIHDRMVHVYKESENVDFLHRLRSIIRYTPKNQYTPSNLGITRKDLDDEN